MPSLTGNAGNDGTTEFSELQDPRFWETAFENTALYLDGYVRHFGPAVVEELPSVLDYHREAIYYLKNDAVGPVICRLVFIAEKYPAASFVESLAFFLEHDENLVKLEPYLKKLSTGTLAEMIRVIDRLSENLKNMGDDDLSDQFILFQKILSSLQIE